MKRIVFIFLVIIGGAIGVAAATSIDMQAHIGTDEAAQAYTDYVAKQTTYYKNATLTGEGDPLFGALNSLMGSTCNMSGKSYGSLRYQYVNVDRDLNIKGNIIGYYDGSSMNGTWNGNTYNREHTWPQSKGAKDNIAMGYDMQSVRPASTSINSGRGNTAYGESGSYYDPDDEVEINNSAYREENLGSYRGDAARVILYDYLVYGQRGTYKNSLHNGNAQLLSKLGSSGVFESLYVMIKWHMQDPPSLTEMVRNDGAQTYQGNRNPFIDYPDVALRILKSDITAKGDKVYEVTTTSLLKAVPNYTYTLTEGFVCYLSSSNGFRPEEDELKITGAQYEYNEDLGRLTIKKVTDKVTITTLSTNLLETKQHSSARKRLSNGQIVIEKDGVLYNIIGQPL